MKKINGRRKIISMLTDFGIRDSYVGAMRGVILGICPDAILVDISHEIPKHNIIQGALTLAQATPYYVEGSIHLAVVDPDVGTARRRVIVQGRRCIYVGPDNGVLSLAVQKEGIVRIVEITNEEFMLLHPSNTFEGRDVFAPVAAHLAKGIDVDEFGPEVDNPVHLSIGEPERRNGKIFGEVIHIDNFGNVTTNVPRTMLGEVVEGASLNVTIGRVSKTIPFHRTYGDAPIKSLLVTSGSCGYIEIAVNRGSARECYQAERGAQVVLFS